MNRIEVIKTIIVQAHLNSPIAEIISPDDQKVELMSVSWERLLITIPTEYLDDLYLLTEGQKKHSGMLTPADMIKCWKNEYRRSMELLKNKQQPLLPTAIESQQALSKFYAKISYTKQQEIHRDILKRMPEWIPQFQTGNYIPDNSDYYNLCECGLDKNPMYVYKNNNQTKCLWCVAEEIKNSAKTPF